MSRLLIVTIKASLRILIFPQSGSEKPLLLSNLTLSQETLASYEKSIEFNSNSSRSLHMEGMAYAGLETI